MRRTRVAPRSPQPLESAEMLVAGSIGHCEVSQVEFSPKLG